MSMLSVFSEDPLMVRLNELKKGTHDKSKDLERHKVEAAVAKTALAWKKTTNVDSVKQREEAELEEKLGALATTLEDDCKVLQASVGDGVNGIAYAKCRDSSFATSDENKVSSVSCYFRGDLTQKRINEIHIDRHLYDEDDCHKIIHMYGNCATVHSNLSTEDFAHSHLLEKQIEEMHGSFAFVLYDRHWKRIVAARDPEGKEPLYWSTNKEGNQIFFSTDRLALFENAERITEFPAGGIFLSENGAVSGTMNGKEMNNPRDLKKDKGKGKGKLTTKTGQNATKNTPAVAKLIKAAPKELLTNVKEGIVSRFGLPDSPIGKKNSKPAAPEEKTESAPSPFELLKQIRSSSYILTH